MNEREKYAKLQNAQIYFNDHIVDFYTSLLDICPEGRKTELMRTLRSTLEHSSEIYSEIAKLIFIKP